MDPGRRVREGELPGGLPYLAVGSGPPLVFLGGSTPEHRNPRPGLEQTMTLRMIRPLAAGGFEVYFVSRWPGMDPATTFADVAERHAIAIGERFGGPVPVIGHSTGGSLLLQLIADRPDVVTRAVVASAAYALGPVARQAQRELMQAIERTGRYSGSAIVSGLPAFFRRPGVRRLIRPVVELAARRIPIANPVDAVTMLRAEDEFDVRDRLPQIPTETLVAYGSRDYFWTLEMVGETAARMPRARLVLYADRGHALPLAKEFVRDVIAFLPRERAA
ncbi:MAG TPA: alpha/beta hydrolase [Propionibacteriaceae bacterium]|jgi:pimeloyl-ACP methyl ester carboxylesterase|nr:alpha/beta hydrolase [Propionibacteriaceae bacterium]